MSKLARRPVWRLGGERGAALIEFAFVVPLLLAILLGTAEFGLAFKERLAISAATERGARIGATVGIEPEADYLILSSTLAGLLDEINPSNLTNIIIYEADASGNMTANQSIYTYSGGNPSCPWIPCPKPGEPGFGYGGWGDPANRNVTLPDPTILGVQVNYNHNWLTGFIFPSGTAWSEDARVRLEPQSFQP